MWAPFQSNIQENKDWNFPGELPVDLAKGLFQSNIQENKDWNLDNILLAALLYNLSEQHPREQGLKLMYLVITILLWIVFQSNIQENKDWNISVLMLSPR